jgi:hypothetical protein
MSEGVRIVDMQFSSEDEAFRIEARQFFLSNILQNCSKKPLVAYRLQKKTTKSRNRPMQNEVGFVLTGQSPKAGLAGL